jgi:hypothetical protein
MTPSSVTELAIPMFFHGTRGSYHSLRKLLNSSNSYKLRADSTNLHTSLNVCTKDFVQSRLTRVLFLIEVD